MIFFSINLFSRKLIDRLDNMKKHAAGNGSSQCVLCADSFGMLGASSVICVDCHKVGLRKTMKRECFLQYFSLVCMQ